MRSELGRLRRFEEEARNKTNQVSSLLEELERLKKELSVTKQEKKTIEDWAQKYRDEMEAVKLESTFTTHIYCPAPTFFFSSQHSFVLGSDTSDTIAVQLQELNLLPINRISHIPIFHFCINIHIDITLI